MLTNVEYVIFDEIHYINDQERGHIWEEILIVLPSNISIIMLSATIPNYFEFANWVGKIKNTMVYIEITKTRVVPLQYFLYVNNENIFLVKDNDVDDLLLNRICVILWRKLMKKIMKLFVAILVSGFLSTSLFASNISLNLGYQNPGYADASGYTLSDGTPLNLSDKDQKWGGISTLRS